MHLFALTLVAASLIQQSPPKYDTTGSSVTFQADGPTYASFTMDVNSVVTVGPVAIDVIHGTVTSRAWSIAPEVEAQYKKAGCESYAKIADILSNKGDVCSGSSTGVTTTGCITAEHFVQSFGK